MAKRKARTRRGWGHVRKLPSGRYQASYLDPQGDQIHDRINAPHTFDTGGDADAWLAKQRTEIANGSWRPKADDTTVGEYSEQWFKTHKMRERSRYQYQTVYGKWIEPTFGDKALADVKAAQVRKWLGEIPEDKPSARANAYRLLSQLFHAAQDDGIITETPVHIKGARNADTKRDGHVLTVEEVLHLADQMPTDRRLIVLLSAFCALRPGETLGLRRRDVDTRNKALRIRETASAAHGNSGQIGPAKTRGSIRTVYYPEALHDEILQHLREHVAKESAAHLFQSPRYPDKPLSYGGYSYVFKNAVEAAKLSDVTPHDLRHTGATLAAATGATTRELMARLGHTSPTVAMRYQHAAQDRDRAIADALGTALTTAREQSTRQHEGPDVGQHEDEDHNDE